MVTPAVAVCGGGAIAAVGTFLRAEEVSNGEYYMLINESRKLESRLEKLKTALKIKQPDINNLKKKIEREVRITGEVCGECLWRNIEWTCLQTFLFLFLLFFCFLNWC